MEFHHDDSDPHAGAAYAELSASADESSSSQSHGSSLSAAELDEKIEAEPFHLDPSQLESAQTIDGRLKSLNARQLEKRLGRNGDILDPGGGVNTVIGAGGDDLILGNTEGSFNTIAGGAGKDRFILGREATNDIFDFDPLLDKLGLDGLTPDQIVFGQGTNTDNGGLDQPLDRFSNTVVLDRETQHILASLRFVNAADISENNFFVVREGALDELTA